MYIKLENKFDDKYDMWVDTEDIEKLECAWAEYQECKYSSPAKIKRNIKAYCHVPNNLFGIKFMLYGCYIISDGFLSIDHYKKTTKA